MQEQILISKDPKLTPLLQILPSPVFIWDPWHVLCMNQSPTAALARR